MSSDGKITRYTYTITIGDLNAFEIVPMDPPIVGTWEVYSARWYGKDVLIPGTNGANRGQRRAWEFKADNLFVIHFIRDRKDQPAVVERELKGKYVLNTNRFPWSIDIETSEDRREMGGGGPRKGIVAVRGDELVLCIPGTSDADRPKKLESFTGSKNILRKMKRIKK